MSSNSEPELTTRGTPRKRAKKRPKHGGIIRMRPAVDDIPKPPKKKPGPKPQSKARVSKRMYDFKKKTLPKVDEIIDAAQTEAENLRKLQKERERLDRQIQERKDLLRTAPNARDQVRLMHGLFEQEGLEPIRELIRLAKPDSGLPPKERAAILKDLAGYVTPKPKMVDTQKDEAMHVGVKMMSFADTIQRDLDTKTTQQIADEDYDEFILEDDK